MEKKKIAIIGSGRLCCIMRVGHKPMIICDYYAPRKVLGIPI